MLLLCLTYAFNVYFERMSLFTDCVLREQGKTVLLCNRDCVKKSSAGCREDPAPFLNTITQTAVENVCLYVFRQRP